MAGTHNKQGHTPRTHRQGADDSRERSGSNSRPSPYSPFAIMRQGLDEVERWWSSSARDWMFGAANRTSEWAPPIEAFHRGNEFVVRVEAPGMTRNDLSVEIGEDALTIGGERQREHQDEQDGMFWTERQYGSFSRTIPLPPGAIGDSARATFSNGVLEVVMQAPSKETRRGRRIDISGA